MKFRIYYEDTDAGGIVYHANYIKFCERARSECFFQNGANFDENHHFVVTEIFAKYLKPAFLGDIIEVKTKIIQIKKASLILSQEIFKDKEKIFYADVKVAYLENKKPKSIPQNLIDLISKN